MITNDYGSDYKVLLNETGWIHNSRNYGTGTLALEIFNTLNNLNPSFIKDIVDLFTHSTHKSRCSVMHLNSATSEVEFRNGVGSVPAGGNNPSLGGVLCNHL